MPMDRERHEEILEKIFSGELNDSEKTDYLQELRADYSQVHEEFETVTSERDTAHERINHLVDQNGKLWRASGKDKDPEKQEKDQQKEFSETITISDIERKAGLL